MKNCAIRQQPFKWVVMLIWPAINWFYLEAAAAALFDVSEKKLQGCEKPKEAEKVDEMMKCCCCLLMIIVCCECQCSWQLAQPYLLRLRSKIVFFFDVSITIISRKKVKVILLLLATRELRRKKLHLLIRNSLLKLVYLTEVKCVCTYNLVCLAQD